MTVLATLSQGGTTVELPLLAEGGEPLVIADSGKPNQNIHSNGGTEFPRVQDRWSGITQFSVYGVFRGDDAYQDAIELCDLIHSDGNGEPMVFDIPGLDEFETNIEVSPAAEQERALDLNYPPGYRNYVEFALSLTQIGTVLGSYDRQPETPTDTGSGPIEISGPGGTVELINDIVVDRYVGRPNDVIRRQAGTVYPRYEIKRKILHDEFEISLLFSEDTITQTQDLAEMFSTLLGRQTLTLDFNGLYGLGEFDVVPYGSSALRHVRESGKGDIKIIPSINLLRAHQD